MRPHEVQISHVAQKERDGAVEGQSAPTEKHWWLGRLLNYGQHAVVCSQIQALCATPSPPMHSDTAAAEHQPPSMHSHIIAHVYPPMILPFEMVHTLPVLCPQEKKAAAEVKCAHYEG